MEIIQIKENQKEEWNKFVAENCSESFLQAWEWGEFQKSLGRKIFRIGVVEENSKLLAVALLIKQDLPLGRSYFYCPRGPVMKILNIKYQILNILDFLFSEIRKIAKKEKALFLRFDPPMEMNNCEITKGSTVPRSRELWSQYKTPSLKKGAGGIFKKTSSEVQPRDTLILDITKSEEELLKEMKQKTRYNIRLAGKKNVNIKYLILNINNKEEFKKYFEEFWKLVEETSERDKFKSHYKNYYWGMLESLGTRHTPSATQPTPLKRGINCTASQSVLKARLYFAEYDKKIIASNLVLYFGDYCVYLHGASSNKYRNIMAPYLLQWRQILDAKKIGCKVYDFWGVVRQAHHDKSKIQNSWQGITRFKKGFGGCEKNYIGAYDLVFNNIGYAMYRVGKFIKF